MVMDAILGIGFLILARLEVHEHQYHGKKNTGFVIMLLLAGTYLTAKYLFSL